MVMLTYAINEINEILGKQINTKKYEDVSFKYGLDLEVGKDVLNFELTSDRVDIVSKYSLSNVLAAGLDISIKRDKNIGNESPGIIIEKTYRPFVNILHVKLVNKLGEDITEIIKMQERLDKNVGRNRKKAAIGIFDYNKIDFPIRYHMEKSKNINFSPLGYDSKKTYIEIINGLDKGKEYKELLGKEPIIWSDSKKEIIAMPPIINSNFHSVTKETKDLLIDITGTDASTVNAVTKILLYNFQFIGRVSILSAIYKENKINPQFSLDTHKFVLSEDSVKSVLGCHVSANQIARILKCMDYSVKVSGKDIAVEPPFYRQDIMHQVDRIDDVMRSIGVENIPSITPHSYTEGGNLQDHYSINNIKEVMLGFGYLEIDINTLTNERYQFGDTYIKGENYASLMHLKSGEVTMASKNIFPELLRLISNNLHKKFPQNIFSLSDVVVIGGSEVGFNNSKRLSIVSCSKDVNVTEILSIVKKVLSDSFSLDNLKTKYNGEELSKTFIPGRGYDLFIGKNKIGFAGEVHPRVLNSFGIELPIAIAEIYIGDILYEL